MKKMFIAKLASCMLAVLGCFCAAPTLLAEEEMIDYIDSDALTEVDVSLAMQTSVPRALTLMEKDPGFLGVDVPDNTVLGKDFTLVQIENGEWTAVDHAAYYPISADGTIIGFITLDKYRGDVSTTIGSCFVNALNTALHQMHRVTLVSMKGCFVAAVGETGDYVLLESNGTMSEKAIGEAIAKMQIPVFDESNRYALTEAEVFDMTLPTEDVLNLYSKDAHIAREQYYQDHTAVSAGMIASGTVSFDEHSQ